MFTTLPLRYKAYKIHFHVCATYHIAQNLAVENFGGKNFGELLPMSILADKTLADWLPCTAK